ncbi:hypothetical protein [Cryobacterium sp. PAMC25264]|uniref:hypothetical protein n=1 Tax=Cryobacterium sp. PAMC25264 TaxID=2861288 RepID=UPI001C62A4AF|nr:hypothetical protein [Cryobacterium sp. PAMC25264]QYF73502.1 hypothetical protein KY500_17640 [Cryobacterium sp. PAMC25264]
MERLHEYVVAVEPAEDVDVEGRPGLLREEHLHLGGAVPDDRVAGLFEEALQREALQGHIDRVFVGADVADVGVIVVRQKRAGAHRTSRVPPMIHGVRPKRVRTANTSLVRRSRSAMISSAASAKVIDWCPHLFSTTGVPEASVKRSPPSGSTTDRTGVRASSAPVSTACTTTSPEPRSVRPKAGGSRYRITPFAAVSASSAARVSTRRPETRTSMARASSPSSSRAGSVKSSFISVRPLIAQPVRCSSDVQVPSSSDQPTV